MSHFFVSQYGEFKQTKSQKFSLIDNYVYLHHTGTLIVLPTFPESITDSMATTFGSTPIMGRSAPIYSYSSSGPRSFDVRLTLHRDMMNEINTTITNHKNINIGTSMFSQDSSLMKKIQRNDYVDIMINELQSIAFPNYRASEKMVDPPLISIRFGDEIFCKGIVDGGVTTSFSGPILDNPIYDQEGNIQYTTLVDPVTGRKYKQKVIGKGKYAIVDITFKVTEIDPYDALSVASQGSFRGINRTLERNLYKVGI